MVGIRPPSALDRPAWRLQIHVRHQRCVAGHRRGGSAAGELGPRGAVAKEKRIAAHYKYALDWTFRAIPHDVPAIIVAEDDLLFAPDFMAYFRAVAPLLESDETVWSASAWNDNAFVHNVDVATGATELRRTTHFPGLSWILPRALWVDQLEAAWPAEHWVSFFDIFLLSYD